MGLQTSAPNNKVPTLTVLLQIFEEPDYSLRSQIIIPEKVKFKGSGVCENTSFKTLYNSLKKLCEYGNDLYLCCRKKMKSR